MKAVLTVAVILALALCVVSPVSSKRITRMQQQLHAAALADSEEMVEAEVVADADVEADADAEEDAEVVVADPDPRGDFEGVSASLLNAKALNLAGVSKLFNDNVKRIAAAQGKPARRKVGTYDSNGIAQICNNGNCGAWGADYQYSYGQKGIITAVYNAAVSGKPERIDIEFNYWWPSCQYGVRECMTHLRCEGVGAGDATPCAFSSYMDAKITRENDHYDLYNSAPRLSEKDAPKMVKRNDIKLTNSGVLVVREYYENTNGVLRHTIRHIRGAFEAKDVFITSTYGDDGDYVKTLDSAANDLIRGAEQAARLNTASILKKFFTSEQIDMARMQSPSVPVKAVIGAYNTAYFLKDCNGGECLPWKKNDLVSPGQFGGEGSIALTCSVPDDLTKSKCDVTFTMKGGYGYEYQTFTSCSDIGGSPTPQCQTDPSYFRSIKDNQDRTYWSRSDFVRNKPADAHDVYFTNDRLVIRWKWHGIARDDRFAQGNVIYSNLLAWSTPLTDFGAPVKTNCLSKQTAKIVMDTAAAKKGLKNKIVLQAAPVADLIKQAPYKTIDEAITKIKGIGPINVVYVSFMWNFTC